MKMHVKIRKMINEIDFILEQEQYLGKICELNR